MVWSFVYLAVRNLFALVLFVGRSDRSPDPEQPMPLTDLARPGDVTRRDRLGGLIHEYSLAA